LCECDRGDNGVTWVSTFPLVVKYICVRNICHEIHQSNSFFHIIIMYVIMNYYSLFMILLSNWKSCPMKVRAFVNTKSA
jgi:hypothetical protein